MLGRGRLQGDVLNPRLRAALVRVARIVGVVCAGASALYWVAHGWAKLGSFLVETGVWHTDAVGVPLLPSVATGTPLWVVVAFWTITLVGAICWAAILRAALRLMVRNR